MFARILEPLQDLEPSLTCQRADCRFTFHFINLTIS
jgi:hypothetical protein